MGHGELNNKLTAIFSSHKTPESTWRGLVKRFLASMLEVWSWFKKKGQERDPAAPWIEVFHRV